MLRRKLWDPQSIEEELNKRKERFTSICRRNTVNVPIQSKQKMNPSQIRVSDINQNLLNKSNIDVKKESQIKIPKIDKDKKNETGINRIMENSKKNYKENIIEQTDSPKNIFKQNFFKKDQENFVSLSKEEQIEYSGRFLNKYEKIRLLGKGGYAMVWLAKSLEDNKLYAVKQILNKTEKFSAEKEIYIQSQIFDSYKIPSREISHLKGFEYISSLKSFEITSSDYWLIYELGGISLSKCIFNIKGEFHKGERIYNINHSSAYYKILKDPSNLITLVKCIAQVLQILSKLKIIHFDLKPENILIQFSEEDELSDLKIIDFGSSFQLDDIGKLNGATPEYLPPEVLFILNNGNTKSNLSQIEILSKKINPSSIDVWSLGAILLEIIIGLPHWISYKCKLVQNGKEIFRQGLFASKCRDMEKIRIKQKELPHFLNEKIINLLHFKSKKNEELIDLITKMLIWDPKERINPEDILYHPFLKRNEDFF